MLEISSNKGHKLICFSKVLIVLMVLVGGAKVRGVCVGKTMGGCSATLPLKCATELMPKPKRILGPQ